MLCASRFISIGAASLRSPAMGRSHEVRMIRPDLTVVMTRRCRLDEKLYASFS
jgi:hypothetical protein